MTNTHTAFAGSIPEMYDRFVGPMWFDPYAIDLAQRVPDQQRLRVLELACGTGIATRRLRDKLATDSTLVATDLNPPMLSWAQRKFGPHERVIWGCADATHLPFGDETFNVVACQFGVMFFPDKQAAFAEARRVLVPGGLLLFSTWDSLAYNGLAQLAHEVCTVVLQPGDPPTFWLKPYGWHDPRPIGQHLTAAGLEDIRIERVPKLSTARSAQDAATGMVEGTPCLMELHKRGVTYIGAVTRAVARRIEQEYGSGPIQAAMQAFLCSARRPLGG